MGKEVMAYKVFLSAASWHRPQLFFAVENDGEQWKGEAQLKPDKQATSGNQAAKCP
jgi:hypothetical protein